MQPSDAEYLMKGIYYKTGYMYAFYYTNSGWRESASITNLILENYGEKL